MIIKDALIWGAEELLMGSDSARLDAEILLSYITKRPITSLIAHDEEEVGFIASLRYKLLILKRKKGIPIAYITGNKEFFSLDLKVTPSVLVPRPDTEILVEAVIDFINQLRITSDELQNQLQITSDELRVKSQTSNSKLIILDVGTGSGCIPIAICKEVPGITAVATDVSSKALKVARYNIAKHKLKSRIELVKSNLLSSISTDKFKDSELIVTANLPYIPTDFTIYKETKFEPSIALYGGKDGVDIYLDLLKQLEPLKPKAIFLELFEFQIAHLENHMEGYEMIVNKPMTGDARVVGLSKKS